MKEVNPQEKEVDDVVSQPQADLSEDEYNAFVDQINADYEREYVWAGIASKYKVVTGAKSEQDSKLATRRFAMLIQKLGFPAKFKDFRIHCDVDFPGLAYSDGDDLSSHLSRVLKL